MKVKKVKEAGKVWKKRIADRKMEDEAEQERKTAVIYPLDGVVATEGEKP